MKTTLRSQFLGVLSMFLTLATWGQTNAWINEIHYDNTGTDTNETIEIVIESPGALSDYEIYLYRDSGTFYDTVTLNDADITPGTSDGNFSFYTWSPSGGIQNGSADGIALVYQGTLILGQLLSYEGTFTAADGPANGKTSIDIGVVESNSSLPTESIQLTGSGGFYSDFTWQSPTTSTFGAVNTGQTLLGSGNPSPFITNILQTPLSGNVTPADPVSVSAEVTDTDGIASVTIHWGTISGNLTNAIAMNLSSGNTYVTAASIPAQPDGTSVYYEITATDANATPASSTTQEQSYISQVPIAAPSLIITEVADPSDEANARFVEIHNQGNTTVNFDEITIVLAKFTNGATTASTNEQLIGALAPGDFYIVAKDSIQFQAFYNTGADLNAGNLIDGNGDDTYALYVDGDAASGILFDVYGEIGVDGSGEAWEYENSRAVRNSLSTPSSAIWTASEWTITSATMADMSPGEGETSQTYTYNGTSWSPENPNGNSTTSDNIVIQSGTASFTQDIVMNNLTLNIGASLHIESILALNGDITNQGSMIFISDGTKLGQLATMPAASIITGSGSTTVQRYIPARRAFRFISAPVTTTTSIHDNWQEGATSSTDNPHPGFGTHITGTTIDQTHGFDQTITGNPSLFLFDNPAQTWNPISDTDVNVLTAGKAYRLFVRGDRSIDLNDNETPATNTILRTTGSMHIGDYSNTALSQIAGGFNFVGNPFQAIVNMNKVLENSTNLNPNHYYVWDPNLNQRGGYVTVNLPNGTAVPAVGLGTTDANQYLQPGQAVFVQTLNAGPAEVLFEETDKAAFQNTTDVFRGPQNNTNAYINLQLYEAQAYLNNGSVADGLLVNFALGESNAVLPNDASKLSNIDENVALLNGTADYLSIENRALPVDAEELQLFNNQYRYSNYTYKIEVSGLADDVSVYLKDDYLQIQTELMNNTTSTINFTVDQNSTESTASDRFSFVFNATGLSTEDISMTDLVIYPNPSKSGKFFMRIPGITAEKVQVLVYTLLGQEVYRSEKQVQVNQPIEVKTSRLNSGVYLVKITCSGKIYTGKVLIQ